MMDYSFACNSLVERERESKRTTVVVDQSFFFFNLSFFIENRTTTQLITINYNCEGKSSLANVGDDEDGEDLG